MLPGLEEIKKRRVSLGFTQKELSAMCGVSQSLMAKIESGRINPSYSIVKRIFETLEALEKKGEFKAKDVMNTRLVFASPGDKVIRSVQMMKGGGFSQLPVIKNGSCVGSISEKTILDMISTGGNPEEIYNKKVGSFMDESFPIVNKETSISIVAAILKQNFAVLVNDKGRNVGIITKADLLKTVK